MWRKLIGGREKVRTGVFCAGVSELHASSWDVCLKMEVLSIVRGSRVRPSDVKRSFIGYLHRPSFRVTGPNLS